MTWETRADLRVGDPEREPVIERLKTAYASGRLDRSDLDVRLQQAMTVRTAGELAAVTADLDAPAPQTWRPVPITAEDRMVAALAHATIVVPIVVFPAWIMMTAGRRSDYVRHHAAEAVNFQLTLLLVTAVTFGLGAVLYGVAWIVAVVAGVLALAGSGFTYPWTLGVVGRGRHQVRTRQPGRR